MKISNNSTRTLAVSAFALATLSVTALGQRFEAPITGDRPPETPQSFEEELPNTGTVDRGVVNAVRRAGLVMLSPTAPAYYGDGRGFVSTEPVATVSNPFDAKEVDGGKPRGIRLFSFEW